MATAAEIRNRALRMLGVLSLAQTAESNDVTEVDAYYAEVYADLKDDGLTTWSLAAEVPTELVPHVVALVALHGTETYGPSPARYQRIVAKAAIAKREIRRLVTPAYESVDDPTDY